MRTFSRFVTVAAALSLVACSENSTDTSSTEAAATSCAALAEYALHSALVPASETAEIAKIVSESGTTSKDFPGLPDGTQYVGFPLAHGPDGDAAILGVMCMELFGQKGCVLRVIAKAAASGPTITIEGALAKELSKSFTPAKNPGMKQKAISCSVRGTTAKCELNFDDQWLDPANLGTASGRGNMTEADAQQAVALAIGKAAAEKLTCTEAK